MVSKAKQAERKAEGLCIQCGKARDGIRPTSVFCGVCAQKKRDNSARHHARKIASPEEYTPEAKQARLDARLSPEEKRRWRAENGRCTRCGTPLFGGDKTEGFRFCATCRLHQRLYGHAYELRQKVAARARGEYAPDEPPRGPQSRLGPSRLLGFRMDMAVVRAIKRLRTRDREKRMKRDPSARIGYQTSRVIREAIQRFEKASACPIRKPGYRSLTEFKFHFRCDERTTRIIERHAQARGGNASATICDLLIAAAQATEIRWATGGARITD